MAIPAKTLPARAIPRSSDLTKVLILGGFLGSGKTTTLLRLAERIIAQSDAKLPVAILENEVGEVGVDDKILRADGYSVTNMLSGCACCSLAGELPGAIKGIERDLDPDWIIIEPTGLAIPKNLKEMIEEYNGLETHVSAVVDAKRWRRIHVALERLLESQMEIAETILMNKTDLVDDDELAYVEDCLNQINPDARVLRICAKDGIDDETVRLVLCEEGSVA